MTRPGYYAGRSRRPLTVRPPGRADRSAWRGRPDGSGPPDTRTGPPDRRPGPDKDVVRPDSTTAVRPDTRTARCCNSGPSEQTANESIRQEGSR